jgi:hypothetical protein
MQLAFREAKVEWNSFRSSERHEFRSTANHFKLNGTTIGLILRLWSDSNLCIWSRCSQIFSQ